jgi:hypothetical protein
VTYSEFITFIQRHFLNEFDKHISRERAGRVAMELLSYFSSNFNGVIEIDAELMSLYYRETSDKEREKDYAAI